MPDTFPLAPPASRRTLGAGSFTATDAVLTELHQIVALLQTQLTHPCPAALCLSIERLTVLGGDIEQALDTGSHTLIRVSDNMQSLLDLLSLTDRARIPARQLFSLLTPLHLELLQARHLLTRTG
ncbi:DUF1484 family protein [Chromobacterium sp. CV08]|uniref:DUF1484 family protein n=1 Tax=Chromobacterium sp. CV08 TaxID=3133274 RepID=UPI003DA9306B